MTYTLVIVRNIIIKTYTYTMSLMSGYYHCLFDISPRRVINYRDCYVEMSRNQYEPVMKERPSSPMAQVLDL